MNIMFFSPHSGIKQHSLPESFLAKQLIKESLNVSYVTCGKVFSEYCTCMSAVGMSETSSLEEKKSVCRKCIHYADLLVEGMGCDQYVLNDYLVKDDFTNVEEILKNLERNKFVEYCFDDVPVGKIALYEVLLKFKKMTLDFDDDEWKLYKIYFKNCLLSLVSFRRIYEQDKPDVLVVYSPQYAVNGVCADYMIRRNHKVYFVEGSSSNSERYEALRIWDWGEFGLTNPALKYWEAKKENISVSDLKRIKGHFEELLAAQSYAVYSSAYTGVFDCRKHFNIPPGKKIMLAALSSYDEAFAAFAIDKFPDEKVNSSVYKDQFVWIKRTIDILKDRDDVFLIIRVHPRDFPNKRESQESEQAQVWLELLNDLPANMVLNTPQENISIYDLLNGIDVLLTGWSATGVEALAHGVPVVTYDQKLPSYPKSIHFTGTSEAEYIDNINNALSEGRSMSFALQAYKWLAFNFSLGVIRSPKLVAATTYKSFFVRFFVRFVNKFFPDNVFKYDMNKKLGDQLELLNATNMIINGMDSLYEQLPVKKEFDENIDSYIEKELFPLMSKGNS
jgi:hypothetical protein